MSKLTFFSESLNDFIRFQIIKWESEGFKYHRGHIKLLEYAYYNKVAYRTIFYRRFWVTKKFSIEFKNLTNKLFPVKQFKLF